MLPEFHLDIEKLKQFYKDFTDSPGTAGKKWGDFLYRNELGFVSPTHMFYTILAHSRGKIHATKMGVRAQYEQHAPIATKLDKLGNPKFNHVNYRLLTKEHILEIHNLEGQCNFIGEPLFSKLQLTEEGRIQQKLARLERGRSRLQEKLDKLVDTAPAQARAV